MRTLTLSVIVLTAAFVCSPSIAQSAPADPGKLVFDQWCVHCHGSGDEMPGTNALKAKYRDQVPALLEVRSDLTPAFIRHFVRSGISVMAPFRKTEISDADLDALVKYLARSRP